MSVTLRAKATSILRVLISNKLKVAQGDGPA